MAKNEQRCGKCMWWMASRTEKGNVRWTRAARCGFPVQWPTLPFAYFEPQFPRPSYTGAHDGRDCQCFNAGKPGAVVPE